MTPSTPSCMRASSVRRPPSTRSVLSTSRNTSGPSLTSAALKCSLASASFSLSKGSGASSKTNFRSGFLRLRLRF